MVSRSSRLSARPSALLAALLLLAATGSAAPSASCHIHPPALRDSDTGIDDAAPTTIGPFAHRDDCERGRRALFGELGRCHCSAGFTPGWVGRQPGIQKDTGAGYAPGGGAALP